MIYIGYPCIGKTTLAKEKNNFIDLESSYFFNSNSKANPSVLFITTDATSTDYNKYENYCNLAIDLNNQNFNVFVSSHRQVTDYLINYYKNIGQTNELCIIYPAEDLYADWSRRAFERYLKDKSSNSHFIEYRPKRFASGAYISIVSFAFAICLSLFRYFNVLIL